MFGHARDMEAQDRGSTMAKRMSNVPCYIYDMRVATRGFTATQCHDMAERQLIKGKLGISRCIVPEDISISRSAMTPAGEACTDEVSAPV